MSGRALLTEIEMGLMWGQALAQEWAPVWALVLGQGKAEGLVQDLAEELGFV